MKSLIAIIGWIKSCLCYFFSDTKKLNVMINPGDKSPQINGDNNIVNSNVKNINQTILGPDNDYQEFKKKCAEADERIQIDWLKRVSARGIKPRL